MINLIETVLSSLRELPLLSGPGDLWLPMTLVFATVVLVSLGIYFVLRPSTAVATRVRGRASRDEISEKIKNVSLRRGAEANKAIDAVLTRLEKYLVKANDQEISKLRERLLQAGIMSDRGTTIYYVVRVLLAICLPVGFLLLVPVFAPEMKPQKSMMVAAGLAIAGLYLPYRWLQSKIESRQLAVTEGFPDALDLLVVCVEAGLSLNAAFLRVSQELAGAHPVLAEQLTMVTLELRAGKTREEALRNLCMRTDVDDVNNFVTLMIQSEALGADLAQTLRIQSEEMRVLRMLRAEEKAHKLPVKLAIPLVLFILPTMFAVVLGPALISIVRDILPHMG